MRLRANDNEQADGWQGLGQAGVGSIDTGADGIHKDTQTHPHAHRPSPTSSTDWMDGMGWDGMTWLAPGLDDA
ncbi:hypothetical protein BC831DRAFT_453875, partial [Entophlyctis helioformis]